MDVTYSLVFVKSLIRNSYNYKSVDVSIKPNLKFKYDLQFPMAVADIDAIATVAIEKNFIDVPIWWFPSWLYKEFREWIG